ncbi:MAG: response regulator [bacterium]
MNGEKPYKVLIVDDDSFLLNMYSIKFTNSGFDVTLAGNGQTAIDKLREGCKLDVILMDIVMPVMDGLEALSVIRKEGLAKKSAIMILSNQGQPSDIEKAKSFDIDGYIVKATSIPSEIVTEVYNLLERTKTRREGPDSTSDTVRINTITPPEISTEIPHTH